MTTVINMPTAASGNPLRGKAEPHAIVIVVDIPNYHHGGRQSWRVCEISTHSPEATARDIALAMERARNIGYMHAQADMRAMLGIKP